MNSPLVSIVIPCFNSKQYVADAIRSALHQQYGATEIVVVDDGSTDGSRDVITSFEGQIRYEFTPNRGASAARNTGVLLARGDWIQFLDADDVLHTDKLARHVPFAQRHSGAITYCDYQRRSRGAREIERVSYPYWKERDPVILVARTPWIQTSAPLHRRDILLRMGGFREDLRAADEYDLHLRMACEGFRFIRLPEVLYTVRKVPGGITSCRRRTVSASLEARRSAIQRLEQAGVLTRTRRIAFADKLVSAARKSLAAALDDLAVQCFSLAKRTHQAADLLVEHPGVLYRMERVIGLSAAERVVSLLAATVRRRIWRHSEILRTLKRPAKASCSGTPELQ